MLSPYRCPWSSLIRLEVVDVEDHDRERQLVAIHHREHRVQRFVQRPAIADAGQRIGADFGEGHQVVRLLANFVVGIGQLGGQL